MLNYLKRWIVNIKALNEGSIWGDYASNNSYSSDETELKVSTIKKIVASAGPCTVWDVGCNSGRFSEAVIEAGAKQVIGFDVDENALDIAFKKSEKKNLPFVPILIDFMNPSSNMGWLLEERENIFKRAKADFSMWLAVIHHFVIGSNVPMQECVRWMVSVTPKGIIEFVTKEDYQIKRMLSNKEDIYSEYTQENFENTLNDLNIKFEKYTVQASRTLYFFERRKSEK